MSEEARQHMLEQMKDNPEMVKILSHPAIREFFAISHLLPDMEGQPPISFRMLIKDWEEQGPIRQREAAILASLKKHLLTLPGIIIEYAILPDNESSKPDIEKKIASLFDAKQEVNLRTYEQTLGIKIIRIDKLPSKKPIGFIDI
jgi:hypothetical protein